MSEKTQTTQTKRRQLGGIDGSCTAGITSVPLDYALVFTYIINAGPMTFTLPLIDNGNCDFHIDLFDTIEPTDYQTTVPMTYVDAATLQNPSKPL